MASSMQSILLGNSQAFAATNPKVPCTTFSNDKIVGDTKLDWVDRAHIRAVIGGDVTNTLFFEDVNIDDQVDQFEVMNYDGCFGRVNLPDRTGLVSNKDSTAILDLDFKDNNDSSSQNTDPGKVSIIVGSRQNSKILYRYTDSSHITYVANGKADGDQVGWDGTFTQSTSNPNLFLQDRDTAETCRDRISVQPDGRVIFYALSKDGSVPSPPDAHDPSCKVGYVNNNITPPVRSDGSLDTTASSIPIAPVDNGSSYAGLAPLPGGVGDASATEPSCESEGGSFSWLMCPALELVSGILNFIDSQLNSLLNLPDSYYKCQPDGSGCTVKNAWSRMRNLAYIILIPVMLVMVISTALGFKFVDAYTVKRAMPRLLAAVIFISLSLPIVTIMADIANGVGKGIMGLILGAVTGDNANNITLASLFDPGLGGDGLLAVGIGGGGLLVAGLAASTMAIGLIGVVLLFGLSAVASIIVLFFVMALRQMILVTLMILSPLAILSWIFPGNDKLWKIWKESFTKLLMLYPIVMLLIASGKAFAFIVDGVSESSFLNRILVLVAYIAPYFLIKGTFKLAGSTFGNLAGMVNDRSKGFFDRNRKMRSKLLGNTASKGWKSMRNNKFLPGGEGHNFSERLNHRLGRLANMDAAFDGGIRKALNKDYRASQIDARETENKAHEMAEILKKAGPHMKLDDFSGLASAVSGELSTEDLRDRFLKIWGEGKVKGWENLVEFEMQDGKFVLDDKGNKVVARDKRGIAIASAQGNQRLTSTLDKISSIHHEKGSTEAIREALVQAETFGTDTKALDEYVAYFDAQKRKYDEQSLEMAYVQAANEGGTYYSNEEHLLRAAEKSTRGNSSLRAHMAATQRGVAVNAGRADLGGGAFGRTFARMAEISELDREIRETEIEGNRKLKAAVESGNEEQIKTVRNENDRKIRELRTRKDERAFNYADHMYENSPASIALHHQMKTGSMGLNYISTLMRRLDQSRQATVGKREDSIEWQNYATELAFVKSLHETARSTKPELAKLLGRALQTKLTPIDYTATVYDEKVGLPPLDGTPAKTIRVPRTEQRQASTVLEQMAYVGSVPVLAKTMEAMHMEYNSTIQAELRGQAAAEEMARRGQPPGGTLNQQPGGPKPF
ncbi:hypothetical protein IPO96_01880 [Candidatus Saccharibacteria bacterium]|nr:MAG: hypothetical protein IPO96_01880 [Candidatus Saccharibacteria bacterium]